MRLTAMQKTIIVIEGMDCSGKTSVAKAVAGRFNMNYIDSEWGHDNNDAQEEKYRADFFKGVLTAEAQFLKSITGAVKTRFALSDAVYSAFYTRLSIVDHFQELEDLVGDKLITVLIDIDYQTYITNMQLNRPTEVAFHSKKFDVQRQMFLDAFKFSRCKNRFIIKNDKPLPDLTEDIIQNLFGLIRKYTNASKQRGTILASHKAS